MNACLAERIESARLADWLKSWLTNQGLGGRVND
jgi:hypothetical protein